MKDGIGSEGSGGQININGGAVLNLEVGGVESVLPQLSINDTAKFRIIGETDVRADTIDISEGATLEIDGSAGYGREVVVGSRFVQRGIVRMNLYGQNSSVRGFALDSDDDDDGADTGQRFNKCGRWADRDKSPK
jgi:hypothetical protein